MRQLLTTTGVSCRMDETRSTVIVNGTRLVGCVHSDAAYRKNVIFIVMFCVAFGLLLVLFFGCIACTYVPRPLKLLEMQNTKEDDDYIERCLKQHVHDFRAGVVTGEIKELIGQARAQDGPSVNGRFEAYFRRNVVKDSEYVEARCFDIRNVQPA